MCICTYTHIFLLKNTYLKIHSFMLSILQYGVLQKPMWSLKTAPFTLHFIFTPSIVLPALDPGLEQSGLDPTKCCSQGASSCFFTSCREQRTEKDTGCLEVFKSTPERPHPVGKYRFVDHASLPHHASSPFCGPILGTCTKSAAEEGEELVLPCGGGT